MKIYKLINTSNNKIYIGITSQSLSRRFNCHRKAGTMSSIIKECGKENFKIELIEQCKDSKEAYKKESLYIAKLNSLEPNGYNRQAGGNNKMLFSNLSLKRMSLGQKERFKTQTHPNTGKTGRQNHKSKPVICINDNLTFESARQAGIYYKTSRNNVARVARGERNSIKRLVFKFIPPKI